VHSILPEQIMASIHVSDEKGLSFHAPVLIQLSEEDVVAKSYPKKIKVTVLPPTATQP